MGHIQQAARESWGLISNDILVGFHDFGWRVSGHIKGEGRSFLQPGIRGTWTEAAYSAVLGGTVFT